MTVFACAADPVVVALFGPAGWAVVAAHWLVLAGLATAAWRRWRGR